MGYNGICLWFSESSLYKSSAKTLWFSASVPLSGFVPWWWRYTVSPSVHPTNIRVYMRIYIYTRIYIYMFRSRYLHVFCLSVCMIVYACYIYSFFQYICVFQQPLAWSSAAVSSIPRRNDKMLSQLGQSPEPMMEPPGFWSCSLTTTLKKRNVGEELTTEFGISTESYKIMTSTWITTIPEVLA